MHNEYGDEPKWDGCGYRKDKSKGPPPYVKSEAFNGHALVGRRADVIICDEVVSPPINGQVSAHRSDGGSTDYYAIPAGTRDLDDLIDSLGMSFRIANIFKACMRFGKKDGTSQLYDLNKIIFFASRERDKLLALGREVVPIDLPVNRSVT